MSRTLNEGYRSPSHKILSSPADLPAPGPPPPGLVNTSVIKRVYGWCEAVHLSRRMGTIAGPVGIGKTEGIREYARRHPREVVVVKVDRWSGRPAQILRAMGQALLSGLEYEHGYYVPTGDYELRNYLWNLICDRVGAPIREVRSGRYDSAMFGRPMVLFDEAEYLHRQSIERLRFYNDEDGCYAPIPMAMLFVGNAEFALKPDDTGLSQISRPIADRLLINEVLAPDCLSLEDIRLVAKSLGDLSDGALAYLDAIYSKPNQIRSLRPLKDMIEGAASSLDAPRPLQAEDLAAEFARIVRYGKMGAG